MKALLLLLFLALTAWAEGSRAGGEVAGASASKCAAGEFYKPFDDSCMACDPFCASPCEDKIGCTKCVAGYYTSREDPEWPNACKRCTIPNCVECRSDIYDAWPMQCIQCVEGYIQADNRKRCDPIPGAVAGNIVTKPATSRPETAPQTLEPQPTNVVEPKPVPSSGFVYPVPGSSNPEPRPVSDPGYVLPMPMPGTAAVEPQVVQPTPVQPRPEPMQPMVLPPGYVMPTPLGMGEPQRPVPTKIPTPPRTEPIPQRPAVFPEKPAVVPPQPVSSPNPEVSPETLTPGTCPAGSFQKKMDGSCMECDVNCLPGQCGDHFGCKQCADGYFTRAADPEWPFLCVLCDLPNCVKCVDNAYDAWPTFCQECAPGYELSSDRKCVPASQAGGVGGVVAEKPAEKPTPLPAVKTETQPYPRPEDATENAGLILTPGLCPKGQFQKEHDRTCMQCDMHCEPGSCVDHDGCNQCKPGYYRSRRDLSWPFLCIECKAVIPGCAFCEDGVFDQLPVKCLECEAGYAAVNNGYECVLRA